MVKSKNPGMNMTIWYNLQFFMTPSEKTRPDFLGGQRDSVLEFSEWLEPRSQPRKIGLGYLKKLGNTHMTIWYKTLNI